MFNVLSSVTRGRSSQYREGNTHRRPCWWPLRKRFKVEQALAVRVLDRLVAAADEDAFESSHVAESGDDENIGKSNNKAGQHAGQNGDAFGGGPNLSLAGGGKANRRRSSSANSLSVSEKRD